MLHHRGVLRGGSALVVSVACVVLAGGGVARADDLALAGRLWPTTPKSTAPSMSDQITDVMTNLGNTLGDHIDLLSADMVALRFDGRARRARVKVGIIDTGLATLSVDSVVHFSDGMAAVEARICFGIAGHVVHVDLPEVEMLPTEYHGEKGVQLRVPLYRYFF